MKMAWKWIKIENTTINSSGNPWYMELHKIELDTLEIYIVN